MLAPSDIARVDSPAAVIAIKRAASRKPAANTRSPDAPAPLSRPRLIALTASQATVTGDLPNT